MQVVLPGECLHSFSKDAVVKLGPGVGIRQISKAVDKEPAAGGAPSSASLVHLDSSRSGILGQQSNSKSNAVETCWVEAHSKRVS